MRVMRSDLPATDGAVSPARWIVLIDEVIVAEGPTREDARRVAINKLHELAQMIERGAV